MTSDQFAEAVEALLRNATQIDDLLEDAIERDTLRQLRAVEAAEAEALAVYDSRAGRLARMKKTGLWTEADRAAEMQAQIAHLEWRCSRLEKSQEHERRKRRLAK